MIQYQHFTLENGLKVYVHEDNSVATAAMNILYDVGSRDENPEKTGFAHLFEHLMFGGSQNIPEYDKPLQRVGGENNAFTSPDITNYYITLPAQNLETAFWLESDRMMSLSFKPEVLEVQRKVVIEEFKQRYLNQPYGDIWLKIRPLAYKTHPYQWATIGKDISHIEQATMEDVKDFFFHYYRPNNAIMVVAGNVKTDKIKQLADKWFAPIPQGKVPKRSLSQEPMQYEARFLEVEADVPASMIYKAFQMCEKNTPDYIPTDLLSDILGRSKSSRLHQRLVQEQKLLSSANAFVTGSIDKGLFCVVGKINEGVSIETAEIAINEVIQEMVNQKPSEEELQKVKNQAESALIMGEIEVLTRAMNLAYCALLGNPDLINMESAQIQAVTDQQIADIAKKVLRADNCSTMYYRSKSKQN
ncbi:MAG: insulinase family protein [Thermoflexibacter sp.]|jgi:zinc protease|nr:insulinase family protein [Thermoflexibacter sp.]